jgi:hypothetical protein
MQSGDTLIANQGAVSYQWYYNGSLITGATDYYYVATQSGDYNVVATDENDCEVEAVINDVLAGIFQAEHSANHLNVHPNPASGQLFVDAGKLKTEDVQISVYNNMGEKIEVTYSSVSPLSLDVKNLAVGMYWIEATDGSQVLRTKFMKE